MLPNRVIRAAKTILQITTTVRMFYQLSLCLKSDTPVMFSMSAAHPVRTTPLFAIFPNCNRNNQEVEEIPKI